MLNKVVPHETLYILGIMWFVFILNAFIPFDLNILGIRPRELNGLPGIFFSPFLHGSLAHIMSNSVPLLVMAAILRWTYGSVKLLMVMMTGMLVGGFGTWLFSFGGLVVGASGIVFTLFGFLVTNCFYNPSLKNWASAILVFFIYGGGMFISLLTVEIRISWAAHFWGFMAGILAAKLFKEVTLRTQR